MDRFRMLPSYRYEDNTDGNLLKSVGKPLRDYKIEGNCFQDGVPSPENPIDIQCCGERTVNLFDINGDINKRWNDENPTDVQKNHVINGNQINVYGSTSTNYPTGQIITVEVGKNYIASVRIISFGDSPRVAIYAMEYGSETWLGRESAEVGTELVTLSFTATTEKVVFGFCKDGIGPGNSNCIIGDIQLQKGNTATPYEPYGYKVPVTVGGKNLFDKSLSPLYGIKAETAINYYGTVFYDNACTISMLKPDTTYTVSFECECTENVSADVTLTTDRLGFMLYSGISGYSGIPLWIDKAMTAGEKLTHHATFTTPSNLHDLAANYRLILYGNNYHDSNGVSTNPYIIWRNIKFQEGIPKTYNIYLDEPLRKVGDYADYVDFKNGKVVRNVVKSILTGDENKWGLPVVVANGYSHYRIYPFFNESPVSAFLCSHFETQPNTNYAVGYKVRATSYPNSNQLIFTISNDIADSKNQTDMTAWLEWVKSQYKNGNPIEVFYILTTSTETLISLPQILTEKHTNIISVGTTLQPSKVNYQYYKGGK